MNEAELVLLRREVDRLRGQHRAHQGLLLVAMLASVASLVIALLGHPHVVTAQSAQEKDGVLHVRGLVVEDQNGRERLRLGAPLPDPLIHGVRQKRMGVVSGLLISDANGNERGGYVTADASSEAFLTLDSEDEQKMLLLANPKGGVNFVLTNNDGNSIQLTAFRDGPKLTMRKSKQKVLELPAVSK
ncbi:MAG: hypothetical protein ABFD89_15035 [Bryobacteraceae bacterium]